MSKSLVAHRPSKRTTLKMVVGLTIFYVIAKTFGRV